MTLGVRVARSLEEGRGGLASTLAAHAWGIVASSRVRRRLAFREGATIITVGGSTLGGSGKTPLAIACAKKLAEGDPRVAFVGHAYRARPRDARVVTEFDDVHSVGDEALVAARELTRFGIPVVVGPTRQDALDHALSLAPLAVVDGVAQLYPRRAHLALLAVDAHRPWGAGSCPPLGDLRAPRNALVSACDRVVVIGEACTEFASFGIPTDHARVDSEGARIGSDALTWEELRARRIGLWTALARPSRVIDGLAREGIVPVLVVANTDHATPSPNEKVRAIERARLAGVELWLSTSKCATHLPSHLDGIPVATLVYGLSLGDSLAEALGRLTRR